MASVSENLKILVSGDVEGHFHQLFQRVRTLNTKSGPFTSLFCVGNFFGNDDNSEWQAYLNRVCTVPITTYVLGPCHTSQVAHYPDLDGCELCPNVVYLGRRGILTGSSGLRIAYLSGLEGSESDDTHFTNVDVRSLELQATSVPGFRGIDVLITNCWPQGVTRYAGTPSDSSWEASSSASIAKLVVRLKPRYHFCGYANVFYERLPYRNHKVLNEQSQHVTRFIALAKVANVEKRKWLYAFHIQPLCSIAAAELTMQPTDVTEIPYETDFQVPLEESKNIQEPQAPQYFYDMTVSSENVESAGRKRKNILPVNHSGGKRQVLSHAPKPCWFCLASPDVEKHLVVYLALAKGGLTPDHLLILPIGHFQSTVELTEDVLKEISSQNREVVFYERNFRSQHAQVQVVPVPRECVNFLKDLFQISAESQSFRLDELPSYAQLQKIVNPGVPFFYVELPTGEKLFHRVRKNFPLQFGREVLACPNVLNCADKVEWRECKFSHEEEEEMTRSFRKQFQLFDFTLD